MTTVSVTTTAAVFSLDTALDTSTSDIVFYTADGLPSGTLSSIDFTPALVEITLTEGSYGGFVTQVVGVGFGIDTQSVNLYNDNTSESICSEVEVLDYGYFTCKVDLETAIASDDTIMLKIGEDTYDCANTDPTVCFTESDQSSSPLLTYATVRNSTQIELGESVLSDGSIPAICMFQGYEGVASFEAVSLGSSDNHVLCTFSPGVPVAETAQPIDLIYFPDGLDDLDEVYAMRGDVTVTNPLFIADPGANHDCSFSGGCPYAIVGNGLSGILVGDPTNSYVEVC